MNIELLEPQVNTVGLVGWWKLYEGSAFDYSLQGNDGTVTGTSTVYDYPGLNIAGNDEYINTGDTFQTTLRSSFTLSCWCKADVGQPAASEYMLGADSGIGENLIFLGNDNNGFIFFFYTTNSNDARASTASAVFVAGQETWHNVVGVADSTIGGVGGLKIYFDGTVQALNVILDGDTSGVTFSEYTSALNIYLGAENVADGTPSNFYAGVIDDYMFFNVAKSADEVKSIYEATRGRYGV